MRALWVNKRDVVVFAASAVATALIVTLGVRPKRQAFDKVKASMAGLDAQIARGSAELDAMEKILAEKPIMEDFVIGSEREMLPRLLETLADLGRDYRLEIVSMKPEPVVRFDIPRHEDLGLSGECQKLSIRMSVRATYRDIGEYFNALESIPVLVAVRDLKIKRIDAKKPVLRMDFRIETFSIRTDEKKT